MVETLWYHLCEQKHRALCRELIGDSLEVELAPFSFKLADGGEEIRGAAHAYTPSLTAKITQILEQNEMYDKPIRKHILREHYLNIAPSMSAAVPPVEKRKKKLTHESSLKSNLF